jgi:hypothetical protein
MGPLFMTIPLVVAMLSFSGKGATGIVQAEVPSIPDTATFTIVKSDFGFPESTTDSAFSITKSLATSDFVYTGTANQTSTTLSNPWLNLKSSSTAGQRFTHSTESGSLTNKWHLTSITIDYTKVAAIATRVYVNLNSISLFSFVRSSASTDLSVLNQYSTSYTTDFAYSENITTFSIVPTENFYVQSLSFTYTIEYSVCGLV